MFVSRDREKLLQAIVFFLEKTKYCHTLKLFKLLNFLDFEHFRQTGRTVTGLKYQALLKGPVPLTLWREIRDGGRDDFRRLITVIPVKDDVTDELRRRDLRAKAKFDQKIFTRRELNIMGLVAEFFRDLKADDMSEFSHRQRQPWSKVFSNGKGQGHQIPPDHIFEGEPLMHDVPSIDKEALAFRRGLLEGIQ